MTIQGSTNHLRRMTVIDLFAGCGGLSLGLELAGFTPILVNELSPDAMATYVANRPYLPEKYRVHDIKELLAADADVLARLLRDMHADYGVNVDAGDVDLVVGGPPCQGYSAIGHRRSYSVERKAMPSNHLFHDMARVIRSVRPRAFLFENVRNLLNAAWSPDGAKGEIWSDVLETLRSIDGYLVEFALVHASDYGVPQNRPRVLAVGIRNDIRLPSSGTVARGFLPEPTGSPPDIADVLGDLVDADYKPGGSTVAYPRAATTAIQRWFRARESGTVSRRGDAVTDQDYSNHSPSIIEKFSYMLANGGVIPDHMQTKKFAQRVLPARWDERGPTITVTSLPDDYVHFSQPRSLTVREWARLQTFPDHYAFCGKRTTGGIRRAGNPREGIFERELPKYTQIGNAVPVLMARAVGMHFASILGTVGVKDAPMQVADKPA